MGLRPRKKKVQTVPQKSVQPETHTEIRQRVEDRKNLSAALILTAQRLKSQLTEYKPGINYNERQSTIKALQTALKFYELRKGDKAGKEELEKMINKAKEILKIN